MKRSTAAPPSNPNVLAEVHTRLFKDSVEELKRRAAISGTPWHIELRLLVRRALTDERREVLVLKDQA